MRMTVIAGDVKNGQTPALVMTAGVWVILGPFLLACTECAAAWTMRLLEYGVGFGA